MKRALVWLRRDYRLHDNPALSEALKQADESYLFFNFDPYFLDPLKKTDRRITWIIESLMSLNATLSQYNSRVIISHGPPQDEIPKCLKALKIEGLFFNRDYSPYAIDRDDVITKRCKDLGVTLSSHKDHLIFEPEDVSKEDGAPYTVFTPFKKAWLRRFQEKGGEVPRYNCDLKNLADLSADHLGIQGDLYTKLGFQEVELPLLPSQDAAKQRLTEFSGSRLSGYKEHRDFPGIDGCSQLSTYIRYGLVSIRECFQAGLSVQNLGAETWVSELIWREFYQMILGRFPHVVGRSFKPAYESIEWWGDPSHFEAWKEGMTGFPLVDAAMRDFKETGLMHNRLRMVVASFLCKTLLLDWRLGESYFAENLLDFELASNNGGWQWAASSGCDAQPYFRIFNPHTQAKKFDPDLSYIQKHCPEIQSYSEKSGVQVVSGCHYPAPIVDYKENRQRAIEMYKSGLASI